MPDDPESTPAEADATPDEAQPTTPSEQAPDLADAGKKAIDAERKARRDAEKRTKAIEAELTKLQEASMSDMEKALNQARQEATLEAAQGFGARLVDAEVKAAASGRLVDVDALLDGLDRTRFLTDNAEPDTAAIVAWVDRIAPPPDPTGRPLDLGQGVRTPADAAPDMNRMLRNAAGRQ